MRPLIIQETHHLYDQTAKAEQVFLSLEWAADWLDESEQQPKNITRSVIETLCIILLNQNWDSCDWKNHTRRLYYIYLY